MFETIYLPLFIADRILPDNDDVAVPVAIDCDDILVTVELTCGDE